MSRKGVRCGLVCASVLSLVVIRVTTYKQMQDAARRRREEAANAGNNATSAPSSLHHHPGMPARPLPITTIIKNDEQQEPQKPQKEQEQEQGEHPPSPPPPLPLPLPLPPPLPPPLPLPGKETWDDAYRSFFTEERPRRRRVARASDGGLCLTGEDNPGYSIGGAHNAKDFTLSLWLKATSPCNAQLGGRGGGDRGGKGAKTTTTTTTTTTLRQPTVSEAAAAAAVAKDSADQRRQRRRRRRQRRKNTTTTISSSSGTRSITGSSSRSIRGGSRGDDESVPWYVGCMLIGPRWAVPLPLDNVATLARFNRSYNDFGLALAVSEWSE